MMARKDSIEAARIIRDNGSDDSRELPEDETAEEEDPETPVDPYFFDDSHLDEDQHPSRVGR